MPRFKTSDVVDSETQRCTFAELSLSAPLLRSLQEMGCEHPSPVQLRTIPQALGGGDVIVQAKSGTGKTIAFCSVVLEGVNTSSSGTSQAIILAPTREIAMQISDELRRLGWYIVPVVDVACFIGGIPVEEDEERLQSKGAPHIAVGTPGRMFKLLRDGGLLTDARFLVLDEADKLLDENFRQDIISITELVFTKSLQFLAVSATFPPPLVALAEDLFVHVEKKRATRGQPVMRDLPNKVFLCTSAVKKDEDGLNILQEDGDDADVVETALLKGVLHLRYVLQGYHVRQKVPALLEVLTTAAYQQAFVFVGDSNNAIQIAELLNQAGVPAAASTGKLDQAWRAQAFAGLKRFQYRVLVCTDLMARGIDAEKVDVVVNLDLPTEKETYLHRSGRTARFGSVGWMVSLVFEGDEAEHLEFFQKQLGFELAEYADREAAIQSRLEALSLPQDAMAPSQAEVEQFPQQPFPTPGTSVGGEKAQKQRGQKKQARQERERLPAAPSPGLLGTTAIPPDGRGRSVPPATAGGCGCGPFPSSQGRNTPMAKAAHSHAAAQASWLRPACGRRPAPPRHGIGLAQASPGVSMQGLVPPPVLHLHGAHAVPPIQVPEWQSWMLDCSFAKYAEQGSASASNPFLASLSSGTRQRLDALWQKHCDVWIGT